MAMRVHQKAKNHCGTYGTLPERQEAIRTGAPTYLSPNPCHRGHTSPRRTRDGQCLECQRYLGRIRHDRKKNRGFTPVKASSSLAETILMRGAELTPGVNKREPACQPHTTKK